MQLKLSLILVALLALSVACSVLASSKYELRAVYSALIDGETEKARLLLKHASDSYTKKFLHSCLELSEGNFRLAKLYADQLVAEDSKMPEGRVLLKLIERRSVYHKERWMDAFIAAWRAAGSPELILHEEFLRDLDGAGERASIQSAPDDLLVSRKFCLVCSDEEFVELCIVHTTPETPFEIKLLALAWLDDKLNSECVKISNELRKKAQIRQRELVQQLSAEFPTDIKFAVRAALDHASGNKSFLQSDIDRLEEAAARQRLGHLLADLYSRYKKRAIELGLRNPQLKAWNASWLGYHPSFSMYLTTKAVATANTASKEIRDQLSGILEKVGKAHLKERTFIDLLNGSSILLAAAVMRGDKVDEQRIRVIKTFAGNLSDKTQTLSSASLLWPIRSLNQDMLERSVEDQIGLYLLLTGLKLPPEISVVLSGSPKKGK